MAGRFLVSTRLDVSVKVARVVPGTDVYLVKWLGRPYGIKDLLPYLPYHTPAMTVDKDKDVPFQVMRMDVEPKMRAVQLRRVGVAFPKDMTEPDPFVAWPLSAAQVDALASSRSA